MINTLIINKLPGNEVTYKSCDSVGNDKTHEYPIEFINTLNPQGIPPHRLILKPAAVIILLRNLNPMAGHVNGTRYIINNLLPHVIDATAITGTNVGAKLFIPRIGMIPKDASLPFEMTRKQFPVKLAYSLTANKAQGQTLEFVGVFISKEFIYPWATIHCHFKSWKKGLCQDSLQEMP